MQPWRFFRSFCGPLVLGWTSLSPAFLLLCSLWGSKQHGILLHCSAPGNQHLLRSVLTSFSHLFQVVCFKNIYI